MPENIPNSPKSSTQETPAEIPQVIGTYAWQKTSAPKTSYWVMGTFLALSLLLFQIVYFIGYPLTQSQQFRPWLAFISHKINYPLPAYRNLSEFTIIASALKPVSTHSFHLQISFINHADFAQHLPNIQLTLYNLYGGILNQRVFFPREYLGTEKTTALIKSSATSDIKFFIAIPEQNIGGYSIQLK